MKNFRKLVWMILFLPLRAEVTDALGEHASDLVGPTPKGGSGWGHLGICCKLSDDQWNSLAGEKLTGENQQVTVLNVRSTKCGILVQSGKIQLLIIHSDLEHINRASVDAIKDDDSITLNWMLNDNVPYKMIIGIPEAAFRFSGISHGDSKK